MLFPETGTFCNCLLRARCARAVSIQQELARRDDDARYSAPHGAFDLLTHFDDYCAECNVDGLF